MSVPRYGGWSAYADSVVDVLLGDRTVTLAGEGAITGGEWMPERPVYVITAYNPGAVAGPDANEDAQARLHDLLAEGRLSWVPAVGRSRDAMWREPSVAVVDISEAEAIAIGRRFDQDAVFKWDGHRLLIVSCGDTD